ncbi:hydroxymethylbutenyl pyrophosphate reductase IspH [Butyrivibrio proteoclasticus B316]|uniref:4-hydroxy-3-methylbut-2-enyl diphosphate reductase n=1 Tax=Butyrivibrio proteoclasticus (strain ATCC 51982 / DSM 14932 / B316) TaxID=515622 RepID=E0RYS5_BUTPB|nr:4-hydroxy-3-methylbut-2-enyl diphosphate reductase [Butyrivibrio proteoclasticus]ADL34770.1 hydroxymethylbutenyl pyrophosphate reductase IspH [Butyrivibrio proteoclasticus B316]
MEVIVAQHAGFCFGVTKAVDTVYEQIDRTDAGNIYTYGPIIHNETVVSDLEKKGVRVIESEADIEGLKGQKGTIVIRSHGVTRKAQAALEETGLNIVDATCPFVKRIHKVVAEESQKGKSIIVVGSANHPEVEGIVSYVQGKVYVIDGPESAEKFDENRELDYTLVAQTTFNKKKFQETVEIFKNNGYNINIVNTICNATDERQTEAEEIASKADAMIVIGGAHSSNSRKLYEICKEKCADTYFIQTLEDLHLNLTENVKLVGITAGASTPKNIIEEVQNYVRTNF